MSNAVFPTWLPGLMFTQSKKPHWKTDIQTALSGKESRQARQASPLYRWTLSYEFLGDSGARTNLLPYSNDFTQWNPQTGAVALANVIVAPDGTLNGDQLSYNGLGAAGGTRFYNQNPAANANAAGITGQPITSSVWLRTVSGTAQVNLADNAGGSTTVTVTSVWQRFSLVNATGYTAGTGAVQMLIASPPATNTPFLIFAWGAQQEVGTIATTYIPTFGSPSSVRDLQTLLGFFNAAQGSWDTWLYQDPAFNTVTNNPFGTGTGSQTVWQLVANYAPLGSGGFAEVIQNLNGPPQIFGNRLGLNERFAGSARQNLLLQSQTMATTWTAGSSTPTNATGVAPDGTTTGTRVLEVAATATHNVNQAATVPAATQDLTFTIYMNPAYTRTWGYLSMNESTGSTSATCFFNLSGAGSVGTLTTGANWVNARATITPAANGWFRCTVTATKISAATTVTCYAGAATGDTVNSYLGVATNGIGLWGAQLEVGPFSTWYLPTTTAASASTTDYTISSLGVVTFTTVPPNQTALNWSGSFYYRCRFAADDLEVTQIFTGYWEGKKVDFQQVRL